MDLEVKQGRGRGKRWRWTAKGQDGWTAICRVAGHDTEEAARVEFEAMRSEMVRPYVDQSRREAERFRGEIVGAVVKSRAAGRLQGCVVGLLVGVAIVWLFGWLVG